MPFQSEKQRRYLWANEPEIAREWTDRYGARGGGIMRVPLANGSFNTNLLRDYLQNDPLRNIYNLDPSVIKSYEQDLSPRAAQAAKDAIGYTRPYGDDPNLFIKDLDKFGMQPTGPLYGAPIMDDAWLDSPAYEIGMNSPGDIGSTSVSGVNRIPQTYREMMHAYLNEGKGSYKRDFATQGMIEDNPTITERNKQIGETIGHEARHQLLADNPEFYEDIDDSLVANIGATGTDKHEILNRMLDFQAYNDPGAYEDIYEDMHGDMPRHLSSPIADKFSEQATAFTDKMLQPYQKPKYSPQRDFPETRRRAEEKMDPERPQKKGLWDSITGGITNVLDNTMIGKIAAMNNALNPRAWNYNPALQGQIDFMKDQGRYGVMDASGLNKITGGVLQGKGLQSFFGSNDLGKMYDKSIAQTQKTINNIEFGKQWSTLKKDNPDEYYKKLAFHQNKLKQKEREKKTANIAARADLDKRKAASKANWQQDYSTWTSPSGRDHATTGGIGSPESKKGPAGGSIGASRFLARGGRASYFNGGIAGLWPR